MNEGETRTIRAIRVYHPSSPSDRSEMICVNSPVFSSQRDVDVLKRLQAELDGLLAATSRSSV
jgi:hypothetical protein